VLWKVFLAALAIRWTNALVLFITMGEQGLIGGVDSTTYIHNAKLVASAFRAGELQGWDWLGPDPVTMPVFTWLTAFHAYMFGAFGQLTYVLMQSALDAGTCVLVYRIAHEFNPNYALPAAVAAAINPTLIVLSGVVLTDTPFVFFVALFLFSSIRWLREPTARWAALIGFSIGAAALTRILAAPWAAVLLAFLLAVAVYGRWLSRRIVAQIAMAAVIVGLCLSIVLWRNVSSYDSWALSSQGGWHLAVWIVPLTKEAKDGTPWAVTHEEVQKRMQERFGPRPANPFEESRRYSEIGWPALAELGWQPAVKAWAIGMSLNLATPAIVIWPPVFQLPRTGFYATSGSTFAAKVANFLFRSDSAAHAWALLLGLAGVAVVRVIQLFGLIDILRQGGKLAAVLLLGGWCVFVLVITGPVASPKYRLPLEPVLMVLTGAGFYMLRSAWLRRKSAGGK
jgi:4-amino-4-deoxy-L-arabinose transferase-like glycosyltransferase